MPKTTVARAAEEAMRQEMARDPEQFRQPVAAPEAAKTINPNMIATLAGLADAASTYYFTKTGKGREGNAALAFTDNHPEATALAALGGLAASKGVTALVRKLSPKAADALAANLGALQATYAVNNLSDRASSQEYQRMMQDAVVRGSKVGR